MVSDHGRQDDLLPFDTTVQQVDLLRAGGLPLEFCAYDKGHTIDQVDELPAIREFVGRHLGVGSTTS